MNDGRPTEVLKAVAGIIRDQLFLREDQVILARQKFDIPPTGDVLIVLSAEDTKMIGTNFSTVDDPRLGMRDVQYATVRDLIQIDVLAMTNSSDGSNQARNLRNQVLIAFSSSRSQHVQEDGEFSIAKIPTGFVNTSALEETQFLERYTATLAVTYGEEAESFPDYFDGFDAKFREDDDSKFTDAPPVSVIPGG